MDLDSFASRWIAKEHNLGLEMISSGTVLCAGGVLPRSAAPCLTFEDSGDRHRIWERFGIERDWSDDERAKLREYRLVGSDGAGNPICIEEPTGSIWVLDHEDKFRSRQFMNSGIGQLAECLLAYMGETEAERFARAIRAIDATALAEGAFWWQETQNLSVDDP